MKITRSSYLFIAVFISTILLSCSKFEDSITSQQVYLDLPETPYDYNTISTGGFDANIGINNDEASLGRVLFYDTKLSLNNSVSCASCHKQARGFADDKKFSTGFQNHNTLRNTLPIQNISRPTFFVGSLGSSLFWDGRADFLQTMVLLPMLNHVEMGMPSLEGIVEKVRQQPYYPGLFEKAYGNSDINIELVSRALSGFVGSIFTSNSKFDRAENGMTQLSALEQEGRNLFMTKYNCNSCHQAQQFSGYETGGGLVNIGLDRVYTDKGLEAITNNPADNGKFKIPVLRNVALTAPYMHDGRFSTLDQVLDHYSHNIADNPALDPRLRDDHGVPKVLNISDHEKTAIIAFLNTMTDYSVITDPKFSNPFKTR